MQLVNLTILAHATPFFYNGNEASEHTRVLFDIPPLGTVVPVSPA